MFRQVTRVALLRHPQPIRRSLTTAATPLSLAFDCHEPPTKAPRAQPILFLHGLFGSKKNNRGLSK